MATATPVLQSAPPVDGTTPPPRRRRRVEGIYIAFLFPALALFTLAITLPAIMGIFYSFTNSIGFGDWEFVGFVNYRALFSDPAIWQSYLFTMGFAAVTVVLVNVLAFLLAVGLTSRIRFKAGLRAIFVIPMVISGIIIAFVFNFLFSNSVPAAGQALGIGWLSESILANPDLAWVAIVIVTAWQAIPGTLLIYIAGLLSIPGDVYEAADLDGASKTQALTRITLPLVRGLRGDQPHPRLQELHQRLRHHRRPDRRRPRHLDTEHRDDDRHRLQRRRLRVPDGQRDDLLHHHDRHLPRPTVRHARKERPLMATQQPALVVEDVEGVTTLEGGGARRPRFAATDRR